MPHLADPARLRSLRRARLGPAPDETFERFAAMVRRMVHVPVALVSLVDDGRQFFPGQRGLPEPWSGDRETPLSHSFCRHVVTRGDGLVIPDARRDPLVCDSPAITDLAVVAYAGEPLTDVDGRVLGSLCAIDSRPREWTADELTTLADLAAACSAELRLRIAHGLAEEARAEAETARRHLAVRIDATERLAGAECSPDALRCAISALVPALADWCVATLAAEPGHPAEVVAWHREPARTATAVRLADAVTDRFAGEATVTVVPGTVAPLGVPVRVADGRVAELARGLGSATVLSVPVVAAQSRRPLGMLTLGRSASAFAGTEVRAALDVGRATGMAVQNCRLHQRRRHVTEVLQRSLLGELPSIPGVELHARYLPAMADATVGGDWYDAFVQPNGSVMLAVGDVCGHDIQAAATMGQLRNLVRGNAYGRDEEPGRLLEHLHAAIDGMALPATATMLLARLRRERPGYTVRYSSAGHLPPLLLGPDGTVQAWWTEPEPLLGLLPQQRRATHLRTVPAGSTLLLYTDGLVEEPRRPLDATVAQLIRLLRANAHLPGAQLCDALLAAAPRRTDDIALLLARLGTHA